MHMQNGLHMAVSNGSKTVLLWVSVFSKLEKFFFFNKQTATNITSTYRFKKDGAYRYIYIQSSITDNIYSIFLCINRLDNSHIL